MIKNFLGIILVLFSLSAFADEVEKWGMFELVIPGFTEGNPFIGIDLTAEFTDGERIFTPEGFYDGNGIFKIRFMPDKEGLWTYKTHSNRKELDNIKGRFTCTPPSEGNHGPVRIRDQYHFGYADGTAFYPFGTTIYEWVFQTQETRRQTLETLQSSPFNKVRFLLVPPYSEKYVSGPLKLTDFPFEGTSKETWNFSRFNVDFWQHFESCLQQILDLGIEADIILFRPYDDGKWGFDTMDDATNDRFTRYAVARLAAFRNVWWSLANENSFLDYFTEDDWDRLFKIVRDKDPYDHLRSIHNAGLIYDYTKPWVTHVSLQYYNVVRAFGASALVRDIYRKAVVNDEINYEGDIASRWGQLSGEEMGYRFWLAYTGGTYATHGEAFEHPSEINWISEGGVLRGQSPSRIAFLRQIIENAPPGGWDTIDHYYLRNVIGKHAHCYLYYFGKEKIKQWEFALPDEGLKDGMQFKVDLIDTWNMTITPVKEIFTMEKLDRYQFIDSRKRSVRLPGKPYMAMRIQRIDTGDKNE
ncbi:DUF5060 domain-containing protein [candidate division KSB1 bacterium]|nr:DUF5060 domain-containing protein [candidate division KSB1 bacterium]